MVVAISAGIKRNGTKYAITNSTAMVPMAMYQLRDKNKSPIYVLTQFNYLGISILAIISFNTSSVVPPSISFSGVIDMR